jgi:hypothetical protein
MSERDRLASREELCVLSIAVESVRTKCRKRGDRTRPLGPAIFRSTAQTTILFSSPRLIASWLRVHTRVTTVTRFEAMYSRPIDRPTSITFFRSGNPRPRPDLRLRSLNRNNGLDCWPARGLGYRTILGNPCAGGPFRTRLDGKNIRRPSRCIFARKLPRIACRSRRIFAKATAKMPRNFFSRARKAPKVLVEDLVPHRSVY